MIRLIRMIHSIRTEQLRYRIAHSASSWRLSAS